jgi:hypothetical protein
VLACAPAVAQAAGGNPTAATGQDTVNTSTSPSVISFDAKKYTSLAAAVAAACNGLTPGELKLPPGTYSVSSPIVMPSNCMISGPRTAIVAARLNFGTFKNSNPIKNVTFDGFTLTTSGLYFPQGGEHITIRNMKFSATASTAAAIGSPASNILISGNECENPASYFCFSIGGTSAPVSGDHDWIISNNQMVNCGGNCILVSGGVGISIQGNTISGCGDTCIEAGKGTSLVVVAGNTVDMSSSSLDLTLVGISTRSSQYTLVTGNKVVGNASNRRGEACYLAWHGSAAGETQLEQYVAYVGNEGADCPLGLKVFQTDHFTIGANQFQNNATATMIDKKPGGARD